MLKRNERVGAHLVVERYLKIVGAGEPGYGHIAAQYLKEMGIVPYTS
jgi:D-arabinose 1-dehydrogenase-like Zn-dependent alcohol dehydrogenase